MPTYDYECEKCGVFEHKQSIKDDAFEKCPKCGGSGIKRLVSRGSGIIFKGSGFYATDYKKPQKGSGTCPPSSPSCGNCPKAE